MSDRAIWWVRRDLRLHDNAALQAAADSAAEVLPLFILDPFFERSPYVGPRRLAFLYANLRALDRALQKRGSRLIVRSGDPLEVLPSFLEETGSTSIHAQAEYAPYGRRRDNAIAAALPLETHPGLTIFPPDFVRKADGDPYVVYSPYSRKWRSQAHLSSAELLAPPETLSTPDDIPSDAPPDEPAWSHYSADAPFPIGEAAARERLFNFAVGLDAPIHNYAARRDRLDVDGTSQLSPYLRFGLISPREALVVAQQAREAAEGARRKQADTWIAELIWREFYWSILYHFPRVLRGNFYRQYDALVWSGNDDYFEAWCRGQTGYPVVDAAMRQMNTTGWMHNRSRMIVASFLVKDLLVDWRRGERYFMQQLVDGDPAANNGGWQWSAGTGTDAAPYFRIFNPTSQAEKHDPQAEYIRRFVPELRPVPDKYIHAPWQMPREIQEASGCIIGEDYPAPIVDHGAARERTLAAYQEAREAAQ